MTQAAAALTCLVAPHVLTVLALPADACLGCSITRIVREKLQNGSFWQGAGVHWQRPWERGGGRHSVGRKQPRYLANAVSAKWQSRTVCGGPLTSSSSLDTTITAVEPPERLLADGMKPPRAPNAGERCLRGLTVRRLRSPLAADATTSS